jgi:hypothetical protein
MTFLNRNNKFIKTFSIALTFLLSVTLFSANAQEITLVTIGDMENIQDQNMDYMKQIHNITKNYPAFSYEYTLEDGKVADVTVTGVEHNMDRKRLEVVLFDLESSKNMLKNKPNRVGVFYSVDDPADYKGDLNSALLSNLKYPAEAKDWGVEGTIYVKFVVDENGEIPFATTSTNIESSMDIYLEDLRNQAVAAVKATSGEWEPATVEGVEVSSSFIVL